MCQPDQHNECMNPTNFECMITNLIPNDGKNEMSYFVFIRQKIGSFQVTLDFIILMQVIHSVGHINCSFEEG